jgi:lipopolysaccharide export system protein LptC
MSGRAGRPQRPLGLPAAAERRGAAAVVRHLLPPSRARRPLSAGALLRRRLAVGAAKLLMPLLALALLAAVAFWPELDGRGENSRVSFRRTADPRAESLRVVNPQYRGVDDIGRPYTVTATVAQQRGAEEVIDLTEPQGDIVLTDGGWVHLRADRGRYDRPANRLFLEGDVTIHQDDGTMLRTAEALVLLADGSASGDAPVAAQGSFGTLTAAGFRLTERGAVVVFTGDAHAVLESAP